MSEAALLNNSSVEVGAESRHCVFAGNRTTWLFSTRGGNDKSSPCGVIKTRFSPNEAVMQLDG